MSKRSLTVGGAYVDIKLQIHTMRDDGLYYAEIWLNKATREVFSEANVSTLLDNVKSHIAAYVEHNVDTGRCKECYIGAIADYDATVTFLRADEAEHYTHSEIRRLDHCPECGTRNEGTAA